MTRLKLCPFCGGKAKFDVGLHSLSLVIKHKKGCFISDKDRIVYGNYTFPISDEKHKAILNLHKEHLAERWNKREGKQDG